MKSDDRRCLALVEVASDRVPDLHVQLVERESVRVCRRPNDVSIVSCRLREWRLRVRRPHLLLVGKEAARIPTCMNVSCFRC